MHDLHTITIKSCETLRGLSLAFSVLSSQYRRDDGCASYLGGHIRALAMSEAMSESEQPQPSNPSRCTMTSDKFTKFKAAVNGQLDDIINEITTRPRFSFHATIDTQRTWSVKLRFLRRPATLLQVCIHEENASRYGGKRGRFS